MDLPKNITVRTDEFLDLYCSLNNFPLNRKLRDDTLDEIRRMKHGIAKLLNDLFRVDIFSDDISPMRLNKTYLRKILENKTV